MSHLLWREIFRWPSKGASRLTMYRNRRLGKQHRHYDNVTALALRQKGTLRMTYGLQAVLEKCPDTYNCLSPLKGTQVTRVIQGGRQTSGWHIPVRVYLWRWSSLPYPWKSDFLPLHSAQTLPLSQPLSIPQLEQSRFYVTRNTWSALRQQYFSLVELLMLRLSSQTNWVFGIRTTSQISLYIQHH